MLYITSACCFADVADEKELLLLVLQQQQQQLQQHHQQQRSGKESCRLSMVEK